MGEEGGWVEQNTSGGVNWPRCDSEAKSSACAGRLASDYSLCCTIEMEGRPMAPRLSFGGRTAEKRSTYGCTDPSTRSGTDRRLKIIISPRGMERTRSILLPWFWFFGQLHMWMTFYLLEGVAWHRFKRPASFVFPPRSQFGQIWEQEVGCMYYKGMLHSWVLFFIYFSYIPSTPQLICMISDLAAPS